MPENTPLRIFHPLVAQWFEEYVGTPTHVQHRCWPPIRDRAHVLVSSPTGSGKTFAAFLWAINQLVSGRWPLGQTSVLYVSPLKALNNDIQRNLLTPLAQLQQVFEEAGTGFPKIAVATRSGDTPPSERRRLLRHPPEILITTPESLNLMLTARSGPPVPGNLETVILDEIHAVIGSKRGTHLITAVERLVPLSGEFQRIGLSATVRPLEKVSAFMGGFSQHGRGQHRARKVEVVAATEKKRYRIGVEYPMAAKGPQTPLTTAWDHLISAFKSKIDQNRSTLLFVRGRRLSEKVTHLINLETSTGNIADKDSALGDTGRVAWSHHGSLSKEIRKFVEQQLKSGRLKAIVATSSLELGIDIGALDEVILIQTPPSVSSAIQRIGRAGHGVGQSSRAALFPTHSLDLLEAAVLTRAVIDHDIETVAPIDGPLDVLAQVILSIAATAPIRIETLLALLRCAWPYRNLQRRHLDLTLEMLAGRYADTRIRALAPKLSLDQAEQTIRTKRNARLDLFLSGGTIPDRGYYQLRHQSTQSRIGELDEEYVWEARIGQILTLGTQNWQIHRITHSDVFVEPSAAGKTAPPFWRAEAFDRDFHFSERIARFLESADRRLDTPDDAAAFAQELATAYRLETSAADHLIDFLRRQKKATRRPLPHRHHLLIETARSGPTGAPGPQVIWHLPFGRKVTRPLALAIGAAWQQRYNLDIETYPSNDSIILQLPNEVSPEVLIGMVRSDNVAQLLRKKLEGSGLFGAVFRESAARALLLTRRRPGQRQPLWFNRLRAQKLLSAIMPLEDFPILLEAWRTCLQDFFDLPALELLLSELETGRIKWSHVATAAPSPMAMAVS